MAKEKSDKEQFPQSPFQVREVEDEWSPMHGRSKPHRDIPTDAPIIGNVQNGIFDE